MVRPGTASYQGRTGPWQWRGTCSRQAVSSQRARTIGQTYELVVGAQGRNQPRIAERSLGRKETAWRTLQATHAKFREGLETSDLRLAKQVLNGSYRPDSIINSLH